MNPTKSSNLWGLFQGALAIGASLTAFWAVDGAYRGFHGLLGSIVHPMPMFLTLATFATATSAAVALWAMWLVRSTRLAMKFEGPLSRVTRGKISLAAVALLPLLALAASLWFESSVLAFSPTTDDEGAYEFAARLLQAGRLYVESHPQKAFFDNAFLINDGKLYAQYFLGWPALLAVGLALGISQFINPLLFAGAIPAVAWATSRLAGRRAGWLAALLFAASPMLIGFGATRLSHTSTLFFLAWGTWAAVELRHRPTRPAWVWAVFACAFSAAFFIRPASAVQLLGLWWVSVLWSLRRAPRGRLARVLALVVPSVLLGGLFLFINQRQNGAWFLTAYERYFQYARENDFAFAPWTKESMAAVPHAGSIMVLDSWTRTVATMISTTAFGAVRLLIDAWGSPLVCVPMVFATRRLRAVWATLGLAVALQLFVSDPGVDSIGPTHWVEFMLPLTMLVAAGWAELRRLAVRVWPTVSPAQAKSVVTAGVLGALISGYGTLVAVRWRALEAMSADITRPLNAFHALGLPEPSLVFTPRGLADVCTELYGRHFVFFRPNNDPDLSNPVLWVNDLGERNKELLAAFPQRHGYVLKERERCEYSFEPLTP